MGKLALTRHPFQGPEPDGPPLVCFAACLNRLFFPIPFLRFFRGVEIADSLVGKRQACRTFPGCAGQLSPVVNLPQLLDFLSTPESPSTAVPHGQKVTSCYIPSGPPSASATCMFFFTVCVLYILDQSRTCSLSLMDAVRQGRVYLILCFINKGYSSAILRCLMPVVTFDGHSTDLPNAEKTCSRCTPTLQGWLHHILDPPVLVGEILIDNWLVVWNISIHWE